jgi:hypothetical protein
LVRAGQRCNTLLGSLYFATEGCSR